MSVLIVDDNSVVLASLSALLTCHSYKVETACNGLDATNKCQNTYYELILVDHLMPIMDGIKFSKNLRQLRKYQDTPIIFMTTQGCDTVSPYLDEGLFDSAIDKPINEENLLIIINSFISTNSRQCSL